MYKCRGKAAAEFQMQGVLGSPQQQAMKFTRRIDLQATRTGEASGTQDQSNEQTSAPAPRLTFAQRWVD
jgi:hypothetical protein